MNKKIVIKISVKGAFKLGFKIGVAAAGVSFGYELIRSIDHALAKVLYDGMDKLDKKIKQDRADNAKVYEYHTAEE